MSSKRRRKKPDPRSRRTQNNPPHAQVPRPSVTEYLTLTAVPVFPTGEAGPPQGGKGDYDTVHVLGIPGADNVKVAGIGVDDLLKSGNSLIAGSRFVASLVPVDGSESSTAEVVPNSSGRLAQIRTAVSAGSFEEAESISSNMILPLLSWLAFTTDTAVEAVATVLTERSTSIVRIGATVAGQVKAMTQIDAMSSTDLAPFLAAYREGLSSNSPLYQALSFYKVLEGVRAHDSRSRRSKAAPRTEPSPLAATLPTDPARLPFATDAEREPFSPYLGKTFEAIADSVRGTIRHAIAHLSQGTEGILTADSVDDVRACRRISPVLRYIAREAIEGELKILRARAEAQARENDHPAATE
ncbi:hypothetical protein SPF06_21540 [Sinomonas sp. JGH33]|uniref:Uncharacterized protein n=1 Tax=Sinomonas terricola TaxID=3110330 RepID=A0ABU5TC95_9MICC|nr:methylamine utilization protein MauJ [Sinomonas sp. JGH33]MEA5457309.1 hypothetical protein [Sinomonas sp. JGH33]